MTNWADLPSTGQVARHLGVPEGRLQNLIRYSSISPPIIEGRRRWRPEDVEAAEVALKARSRAGESTPS